MAVMLKHRDAPIPYLCDACPGVPPELDVVFRRMVAKRPGMASCLIRNAGM